MDYYSRYLLVLKNMDLNSDDFASQLYTRKELMINIHRLPYNFKIKVEDSEWDCEVTKHENKLEFKVDPAGSAGEVIIAAIHPNPPEEMVLFSCKRINHMIICNHDSVCEEDKGFINHAGIVKIDIQIQKIVKIPTSLNFIERKLLLQLFWEYEASINKQFNKLFEDTARDISTEMITFEAWPKYTKKIKNFSISQYTLVKEAVTYFEGDVMLLEILNMGYKSIIKNDIPTELPRWVEAKGNSFRLVSPAGEILSKASDQRYSPINLKRDQSFNHGVIICLENNLKKIGCLAFQMYFIKSQFRKNFDEFKTNLSNTSEAVKKKEKPDLLLPSTKSEAVKKKKKKSKKREQASTSEELKPDLPLPSTEKVEYEKYVQSVKTLDELFSKATESFSIAADELKKDVADLLSKHPKNKFLGDLKKYVSEKYIAAHAKIFNDYKPEDNELDYGYYFGKGNWHGGTKHGTKSKEDARQTGLEGEKYAKGYFSRSYGDTAKVIWMNENGESYEPYDLVVINEEGNIINYIEVKSTSLDKKGFIISKVEYDFANKMNDLYTVAHVHIDEKEKKDGKRYKVDVYKNPLNGKQLGLFLRRLPK